MNAGWRVCSLHCPHFLLDIATSFFQSGLVYSERKGRDYEIGRRVSGFVFYWKKHENIPNYDQQDVSKVHMRSKKKKKSPHPKLLEWVAFFVAFGPTRVFARAFTPKLWPVPPPPLSRSRSRLVLANLRTSLKSSSFSAYRPKEERGRCHCQKNSMNEERS